MKNVSKLYNRAFLSIEALKDVNFTIKRNEFISILGEYGSGKNTLFNIIGFIDKPSKGTYLFCDEDTSVFLPDEARDIRDRYFSFIYEDVVLMEGFTVEQNINIAFEIFDKTSGDKNRLIKRALNIMGISHKLSEYVENLSLLEQRKVQIAAAIARDTHILMIDEPACHLGEDSADQLMQDLRNIHEMGKTVIVVTEHQRIAEQTGRILYMNDGKLVYDKVQKNK
ncbi:MAG: ATP-binding cassette domain-containing protein [Clostridia bacterium]|nr:ATP-binding cassette domain-containing protein [Clostridia bacterium]